MRKPNRLILIALLFSIMINVIFMMSLNSTNKKIHVNKMLLGREYKANESLEQELNILRNKNKELKEENEELKK